jgi:hypothetical protein
MSLRGVKRRSNLHIIEDIVKSHITKLIDSIMNKLLPVDIVLGPPWWYKHEGITFDEDFFFHPLKRVESEQKMEQALNDRWGKFGMGKHKDDQRPEVGAVHLAAGFMLSEMLGCEVNYLEDNPPQVIPADFDQVDINVDQALKTPVYEKFKQLVEKLYEKHRYLTGDVNWGGILNIALDLRGQNLFFDMIEEPVLIQKEFAKIQNLIDRFVGDIQERTGTSSVSVNRNVINLEEPVFLHSECAHTMISVEQYEQFLFAADFQWSQSQRPFGIHYCGPDAHRYAEIFGRLPHLDFLDVGWGGDLKILRQHLPDTFMNIRLSPVDIIHQTVDEIRADIRRLVNDSGNPWLTGVCCINMDEKVSDEQISAIFSSVEELRSELT